MTMGETWLSRIAIATVFELAVRAGGRRDPADRGWQQQGRAGQYRSPAYEGDDGRAPANAPGIRHILVFVVDDIEASLAGQRAHGGELENYKNSYWLCYVRGPAGIIVELAEKVG
jgi:hypothetical protein